MENKYIEAAWNKARGTNPKYADCADEFKFTLAEAAKSIEIDVPCGVEGLQGLEAQLRKILPKEK